MTPPYLDDGDVVLHLGDCVEVMAAMEPESVDAVVCDPPYGLEFMGKEWDAFDNDGPDECEYCRGDEQVHHPDEGWVACPVCEDGGPKKGGYQEKARFNAGEGLGGYKRRPNFYVAGRGFQLWCYLWSREALRVLRPGGHLLAFGGTRTFHRLTCAIEDAGFEVRDCLSWLYGSGFPKSLDVGKAIDKRPGVGRHAEFARHLAECREAAGLSRADVSERVVGTRTGACWNWEHHQFPEAKWWPALRDLLGLDGAWGVVVAEAERERTGSKAVTRILQGSGDLVGGTVRSGQVDLTAPATPEAAAWQGWGTALKPAWEPIVVARKPLTGTVASTVLRHGTGALNVDGCRVGSDPTIRERTPDDFGIVNDDGWVPTPGVNGSTAGRWPANVVLSHVGGPDGCREVGTRKVKTGTAVKRNLDGNTRPPIAFKANTPQGPDAGYADPDGTETVAAWECHPECPVRRLDEEVGEVGVNWGRPTRGSGTIGEPAGGATGARDTKGGFAMRQTGEEIGYGDRGGPSRFFYTAKASSAERDGASHPTVKPLALMRWLVRLVTPPGGVVLDPFAGSGTTGLACREEGFRCVLIEREPEYAEMCAHRLRQLSLFGGAS